jgi:hypothetical protein
MLGGVGPLLKSFLAATTLVLLAVAPLRADDKKTDTTTKLPVNVFADAKEGDWSTFVVSMKATEAGESRTSVMTWRVVSVGDDGAVKVTNESAGKEAKDHRGNPFSTKEAPTVAKFCSDEIDEVSAPAAEKLAHDGQTFECQKLALVADRGRKKWTIWLSADVKASGIVASTIVTGDRTVEIKLAGYGTKEKTLWGKTPEEAKKAAAPAEKAPEKGADKKGDKPSDVKAELDLSTKLKAAETIIRVLTADDKESFRKCVSKKILAEDKFDDLFKSWKRDVLKMKITPEQFVEHVKLAQEDGHWKLDEH